MDGATSTTMETRPFGPTGRAVPVIGQGTWKIEDGGAARKALEHGLGLGMTHIDTAEIYRGSEEVIAPVLQGRRDDVFLASKVHPDNATYEGTLSACQASLDRLQTDHLDVYLLHWWHHPEAPEDCMRAMGDLIDDGKVKAAGVSNFNVQMLEQAMDALSPKQIACNQVKYHLEHREPEADLLPFCRDKGIAIVGYTPFGEGPFPRPDSPGGKVLGEIAATHGRTPRQVALRFLTRSAPLFTIPKAEQVSHVEENVGGQGWSLGADEVARIEAAFPMPEGWE